MMTCSRISKLALALTFLFAGLALLSQRTAQADDKKTGTMKFEIYEDASKEYRWRLKAANGQIMATGGQGYAQKASAKEAVDHLQSGVGSDKYKFETYEDAAKEHRWRLKAANGQNVASSSESYKAKADCEAAIESIKAGAKDAKVEEVVK